MKLHPSHLLLIVAGVSTRDAPAVNTAALHGKPLRLRHTEALIDSNGIWAEVDRTFLARRGYPYTKEYYEGVAHTIFPLAAVFTKEYCHLSESTDEIMAEWMELAKDNYAHVALKPHVREYLEKLRAQGERMAVFKSDPAIFAKATELLGVTPQECIFFDDSVKSCRSAKASGMTVIGVYDPFFEGTKDEMPLVCDRFIRDFGEML